MVISLIYTPPFLAVERMRETAMAELSLTVLCSLRWSSFLQDKESWINEGTEYVRSDNVHHQLGTSLPPRNQSLGQCIACQYVGRLYINGVGKGI